MFLSAFFLAKAQNQKDKKNQNFWIRLPNAGAAARAVKALGLGELAFLPAPSSHYAFDCYYPGNSHFLSPRWLTHDLPFGFKSDHRLKRLVAHHACRERRCLVRAGFIRLYSRSTIANTTSGPISRMRSFGRPYVSLKSRKEYPMWRANTDSLAGLEIWSQSVGPCIISPRPKDPEAVQGALDRMVGPRYSQG